METLFTNQTIFEIVYFAFYAAVVFGIGGMPLRNGPLVKQWNTWGFWMCYLSSIVLVVALTYFVLRCAMLQMVAQTIVFSCLLVIAVILLQLAIIDSNARHAVQLIREVDNADVRVYGEENGITESESDKITNKILDAVRVRITLMPLIVTAVVLIFGDLSQNIVLMLAGALVLVHIILLANLFNSHLWLSQQYMRRVAFWAAVEESSTEKEAV